MDAISVSILLEYLYKKFVVTFIMCLIGAFLRESVKTVKQTKLNTRKTLASAILASVLMCALFDYISIPFSIYTVLTIITGMWSHTLLNLLLNVKIMKVLLKNIFKNIKDPVMQGLSDTMEELDDEEHPSEPTKDEPID